MTKALYGVIALLLAGMLAFAGYNLGLNRYGACRARLSAGVMDFLERNQISPEQVVCSNRAQERAGYGRCRVQTETEFITIVCPVDWWQVEVIAAARCTEVARTEIES